jgi:hypothetical protein
MLREESNAMTRRSESPMSKLAPLQDLLFEFQLELKDVQRCVVDILNNPYSLAAVNVTANKLDDEAKGDDDNAELVFETYVLRLSTSVNGLLQLQQKVKSQMSLADMNLKMKRNRILWLNVNLSAGSLAIGFCSGIMASLGMNLPSGFEQLQYSFYGICTVSVLGSSWVYYRLLKYMRGDFSKAVEANQLAERSFLENIFTDIDTVDVVLNSAIREASADPSATCNILSKDEFAQLFAEAKGVSKISQEEIDLVFGLIDINKDDMLHRSELDIMMNAEDQEEEEEEKKVEEIKHEKEAKAAAPKPKPKQEEKEKDKEPKEKKEPEESEPDKDTKDKDKKDKHHPVVGLPGG